MITNIEIALDKARERHIKEGVQAGKEQKNQEIILKMLKHNFSDELIADITATPVDEIRKIRESL